MGWLERGCLGDWHLRLDAREQQHYDALVVGHCHGYAGTLHAKNLSFFHSGAEFCRIFLSAAASVGKVSARRLVGCPHHQDRAVDDGYLLEHCVVFCVYQQLFGRKTAAPEIRTRKTTH